MRIFTDNWEYKLISVVFAIALYFYFSDQIAIGKTLQVSRMRVDMVEVPAGWVVTDIEPGRLEIGIRGPKSLVVTLKDTVTPAIVIGEDKLRDDENVRDISRDITLDVTTQMLGLDPAITIERVSPQSDIQVKVEQVGRKRVPVSDNIDIRLPEGLSYSLTLDSSDLLVTGPAGLLGRMTAIEVRPLDLMDIPADLSVEVKRNNVPLQVVLPPAVKQVEEKFLQAQVTISPVQASRVITVPVRVITPPDFGRTYRVNLNQDEVTVTVRGPQALLDVLNPKQQVRALVDIDPTDANWNIGEARNLPVRFDAPSWLSAGTSQVRVTLELQKAGAAGGRGGGAAAPAPAPDQPAVPIE